jgi:hypothetical protein
MNTEKLEHLFTNYLHYFKEYNLEGVANCYHLPCTLNTPDKVNFLMNEQECQQEFNSIFTQLKEANTSNIVANKSSYQQISEQVFLVNIDWDFFDGNKEVFADFTALYHVLLVDGEFKIFNVISHELSNSLSLKHSFSVPKALSIK